MPIDRVASREPLSRPEFEARLRRWYVEADEERIAEGPSFGGTAWIWVEARGRLFHLNADTRREGIGEYLRMLASEPSLTWHVSEGRTGKQTKVLFGSRRDAIRGFYLYARHVVTPTGREAQAPGDVVDLKTATSQASPSAPMMATATIGGFESLLVGRRLGGRYRVEELLGRGGMGAVFRATDERLRRRVAIKVVGISAEDPDARDRLRARLRREARSAARIHHPNVVMIFDYGTDGPLGLDYIVMELLPGGDLGRRMRAGIPPQSEALRILIEAARGIGAGHRAGLVHRDVKPANLFLEIRDRGAESRVRVLDFGIARIIGEEEETLTHVTVAGRPPLSPAYASPEQLRGEYELTPSSDVFSLAVTGYQLFTGVRPFDESALRLIAEGQSVPAPYAHLLNPEVSEVTSEVLARAMNPSAAIRYPDADTFADAIEQSLRDPSGAETRSVAASRPGQDDARGSTQAARTRRTRADPPAWLGGQGQRLWDAFSDVFGTPGGTFGSPSIGYGGVHDGNRGVQWNAGFEPKTGDQWVGVNLEGMKYEGWPIARLILRELEQPTLPDLVPSLTDADRIELLWSRDYWQGASRPRIVEEYIVPTPVRLSDLISTRWRDALTGALGCLTVNGNQIGRAIQPVTLVSSRRRIEGQVTPHLTFSWTARTSSSWSPFLKEARDGLMAVYNWAIDRSA